MVAAERHAALRAAFAELPPQCQQLLSMLMTDPPSTYAEISATLSIPIGSINPSRARCLDRLRRSPALAALIDTDVGEEGVSVAQPSPSAAGRLTASLHDARQVTETMPAEIVEAGRRAFA